ncbi:MAG: dockerin type I repeat-containing protein [Clostridia bacterium]|nr:dockerin type I repeat-containing protein [Clostridia bacterium]
MKKLISVIICLAMIITATVSVVANDVLRDEEETTVVGDMNGDKEADNKDVVTLFRYVSSGERLEDESMYDFNGDGAVDNKDVVALFRYLSGGAVETSEVTDEPETDPEESETEPDETETEPDETETEPDETETEPDETETEPEESETEPEETEELPEGFEMFVYEDPMLGELVYFGIMEGYTYYDSYLGSGIPSVVKEGVPDGTCFFNMATQGSYEPFTDESAISFLNATQKNFNNAFGNYTFDGLTTEEIEDGVIFSRLDWTWDNGIQQSLVRIHFDYCTVIIQFATWSTVPDGMEEFDAMMATLGICAEALEY